MGGLIRPWYLLPVGWAVTVGINVPLRSLMADPERHL